MSAVPIQTFQLRIDGSEQVLLSTIHMWYQVMQAFFLTNPALAVDAKIQMILCLTHILLGEQMVQDEPFTSFCLSCSGRGTVTSWSRHAVPGVPAAVPYECGLVFLRGDTNGPAYVVETLLLLKRLSQLDSYQPGEHEAVLLLHEALSTYVCRLSEYPLRAVTPAYMEYLLSKRLLLGRSPLVELLLRESIGDLLAIRRAERIQEECTPIPPPSMPCYHSFIVPALQTSDDGQRLITWWNDALHDFAHDMGRPVPTLKFVVTKFLFKEQILPNQIFCSHCLLWIPGDGWTSHQCGEWVRFAFEGPALVPAGGAPAQRTAASVGEVLLVFRNYRARPGFKEMWHALSRHALLLNWNGLISTETMYGLLDRQLVDGDAFDKELLDSGFETAAALLGHA